MTEEHRNKISNSNKGISRNTGKIWITNGEHVTRISPEEYSLWESKGYTRGKKLTGKTYVAWNKGLDITDPRVRTYIENRKS